MYYKFYENSTCLEFWLVTIVYITVAIPSQNTWLVIATGKNMLEIEAILKRNQTSTDIYSVY